MGSDDELKLLRKGMSIVHNSAILIIFIIALIKIFMYVVNILAVYYLSKLEDETCNCIRDWRHNFIKIIVILNIILIPLSLLINNYFNFKYMDLIMFILIILTIIMYFVFVSYFKDLETNKCECAISKEKNLHNFLHKYYDIISILSIIFYTLQILIIIYLLI